MCVQRTICEAVVQKCFFFALFYFLLRLVKKTLYYLLSRESLEKMHPIEVFFFKWLRKKVEMTKTPWSKNFL